MRRMTGLRMVCDFFDLEGWQSWSGRWACVHHDPTLAEEIAADATATDAANAVDVLKARFP